MAMSALTANRGFQLLFAASAISNLGDGVSALPFPWLTTLLTRDPALVALVASATRLPWTLFAIPAGVIIDRGDRKRMMVQADLFSLVLTCGVIGLILSGSPLSTASHPGAYVLALSSLAFLLGSAGVIRDNAAQTVLPSIVEKKDLERANGQIWTVEKIMGSFVGPPLAGVLIALAVPAPFLVDAATFGVAALLIWWIVMPPRVAVVRRSIQIELLEGVRWLLGNPTILRLALMLGFINALSTMAVTMLILVSQEILRLSAARYGALLIAGAAGGVLVLQLRMLAGAVMRLGGTSLVKSSPSRPGGNEGKPGNWVEQQTCEQSMDFRNAEYAGCNQAQAARATGLLSFALLPAACRS